MELVKTEPYKVTIETEDEDTYRVLKDLKESVETKLRSVVIVEDKKDRIIPWAINIDKKTDFYGFLGYASNTYADIHRSIAAQKAIDKNGGIGSLLASMILGK